MEWRTINTSPKDATTGSAEMSMLKRLEEEGVFSIVKEGDKFRVWEECDHFFDFPCTKEDLMQLAKEIIDLANGEGK